MLDERVEAVLIPGERVLAEAEPCSDAPRHGNYLWLPLLFGMVASVLGTFGLLLNGEGVIGGARLTLFALVLIVIAAIAYLARDYILLPTRYLITDRRIIELRGRRTRTMERRTISYARIIWHPRLPTVGDLELVRAAPFGPLLRSHRLRLRDVRSPDALLSVLRGQPAPALGSDSVSGLASRIDPDEHIVWGSAPEQRSLDVRDIGTSLLGAIVIFFGTPATLRTGAILYALEERGLSIGTGAWWLLLLSVTFTLVVIFSVGLWLMWRGVMRGWAMATDTEYVLTNRRLLIRRGRTELSLPRDQIVQVAERRGFRGACDLYLVLDGPGARALADGGAHRVIAPARDEVPPVIFGLRETSGLCDLLVSSA